MILPQLQGDLETAPTGTGEREITRLKSLKSLLESPQICSNIRAVFAVFVQLE